MLQLMRLVSIPFKRESGSKVVTRTRNRGSCTRFQFPSNGKADPKVDPHRPHPHRHSPKVSIPFKRESGSKGMQRDNFNGVCHPTFQFPSNGKADPKRFQHLRRQRPICVSIPFKRESGSKVYQYTRALRRKEVSIPFKRESGSKAPQIHGKVAAMSRVSIPFKRESGSKETPF